MYKYRRDQFGSLAKLPKYMQIRSELEVLPFVKNKKVGNVSFKNYLAIWVSTST